MANLAIKGHPTRGKEIIKILEMFGGYNTANWSGDDYDAMYFINTCYCIEKSIIEHSYTRVLSIEEFLEKFPYKVGDKVDFTYNNNIYEEEVKDMRWCDKDECVLYHVGFMHNLRAENILTRYNDFTKEVMEEINIDRIGFNGDKAKLILPNGYEFKTEGKEVYVVKKEPQYPKTYEECCDVLGYSGNYNIILATDVDNKLFDAFFRLKVYRDAYRKIVGDWKPEFRFGKKKYCIMTKDNKVISATVEETNRILVFSTEEMRDAFYENFKDLIESVKELL